MSSKLGEILVRENLITSQQLRDALEYQRGSGGRLGSNLVKLGVISDDVITAVLSRQYGVPSINLELFQIEPETIKLISQEVALKYSVLPISKVGATLTMAMADPTNVFAMDDIKFMTGLNVEPVIASEASLQDSIAKYYSATKAIDVAGIDLHRDFEKITARKARNGNGNGNGNNSAVPERLDHSDLNVSLDRFEFSSEDTGDFELLEENEEIDLAQLAKASEDAPVVRLVNVLLVDSLRRGASDIHIEPYEKDFRIRFRIDGVLYDVMHPPMKMRDALLSRLKIMAKLDISEKRLPQDGRIKIKVKIDNRSRELDFRVSSLPTLFGEKIVLRLLDKDKLMLDMTKLGFEPQSLEIFQRNISKPYGMVLVTGPTGSGKSTTLAAMIDKINIDRHEHILTIEDPIEFLHNHKNCVVNQREVNSDTHGFSDALRTALRQDPDVVLVGELRDLETIEMALRVAETGHLTFATLHTNSAASTINRIIDVFPAGQQSQIRTQLSLVLEGVMCQALLPKAAGDGRVMALEILIPNSAIRNLIRDDKIHQIYSMMQTGQDKFGMQTFNQALASLYLKKQIKLDIAMQRSSNADELKDLIERGSGLNQSYGGQTKPAPGSGSPYSQGRPVGQRPPVR